jgi:Flp pilus assembly protein TadB
VNTLVIATLTGCLLAFGGWAVLGGTVVASRPRLGDALDLLDGRLGTTASEAGPHPFGSWVRARLNRPASTVTERRLRMAGRSIEQHYATKAVLAIAGLVLPLLAAAIGVLIVGVTAAPAALAAPVLAVAGFFVPDLLLAAGDDDTTQDATEALLTYFDLITLERLANRSGTQSLRAAADISDVTVFTAIRDALERARLEQRPPYPELRRLGAALELPALVDIADVMSLDESGASLSAALQARVRELRDAHLTQAKVQAGAVSERMTFFMVIPALVFAAFFLVPPILRLLAG